MHFDRLNERYAMMKPILPFEQLDQTGLTGFENRSNWSFQPCHFQVRTNTSSTIIDGYVKIFGRKISVKQESYIQPWKLGARFLLKHHLVMASFFNIKPISISTFQNSGRKEMNKSDFFSSGQAKTRSAISPSSTQFSRPRRA